MYILQSLVLALLTVLMLFSAIMIYRIYRKKTVDARIAEFTFKNVDAIVMLIDRDFKVIRTNYYQQTGMAEIPGPCRVVTLFRCKKGVDAQHCGFHELCMTCALHQAIIGCFDNQKAFVKLESNLTLFEAEGSEKKIDYYVSVSGSYVRNTSGEYMLLTIHDITDLKNIQHQLSLAREQAEESDRMKSLFVANTTHELRTPLNAIIGFSELLAGDTTPEEKAEFIKIIHANNTQLLQIVNDIFDLAKLETGTLAYQFTEVDINDVMQELENMYRHRQQNSQVEICFDMHYPESRSIFSDRRRAMQVMGNFLSNAMKYTHNGSIHFGYEDRGEEFYFYVTDTGIGINPSQLESVFESFTKAGSNEPGAGIGLAICKSIVESLGGRVGVESQLGHGSTFWVLIPKIS